MSTDYDCWIASQDPYTDHSPDAEDVSDAYRMHFQASDGEYYELHGLWNRETQEWWECEFFRLTEDGESIQVDDPSNELWFSADLSMLKKTYEDLEKI